MRLTDVKTATTFEVWIKPDDLDEKPLVEGIGFISKEGEGKYQLHIPEKKKIWTILLRERVAGKDLDFYLKRGWAHLAEIQVIASDGSACLRIVFFAGQILEMGKIEIGIDEHFIEKAQKNHFPKKTENSVTNLARSLSESCQMTVGDEKFFLLMNGGAAKDDFELEVQEECRAFSIWGDRLRIPVKKDGEKDILLATNIIFGKCNQSDGALRLARGEVVFSDSTKINRMRTLAQAELRQLMSEPKSYLRIWDQYDQALGEELLKRARKVGKIKIRRDSSYEYHERGIKVFVDSIADKLKEGYLKEGDIVEITSQDPPYLVNPQLTWEDYIKSVEMEYITNKNKDGSVKNTGSVCAKILDLHDNSIVLELENAPQIDEFLVLSIKGDQTQFNRRMQTRLAVQEGRCANPLLGLLIEEKGAIPRTSRASKLKALTPFVQEKIFKTPPTQRQIEAIECALNTPDIALIQGPPGTGKTTVITAIIERLNEEFNKTQSVNGQILVSAFQHDAVENIIARLSVNALPAVKFGQKSGNERDVTAEWIEQWSSTLVNEIRKKHPRIVETENQKRLKECLRTYSLCPSKNNTMSLLKMIDALPRDVLSASLVDRVQAIMNSLKDKQTQKHPDILRYVYALRVREAAFEDDGPLRACDLLYALEESKEKPELELGILQEAARWRGEQQIDPIFLKKLRDLKEKLLDYYLPLPEFRIDKPREDVVALVAEVLDILRKSNNLADKRETILAEFLHELEDNPNGIRNSIEDYTFVYAATVQQALGPDIIKAKKQRLVYDTVIIDEAARVTPNDLLIPMSQAEKRIILVGDHRQLPHILDEEIAKTLNDGESSDFNVSDILKKSMFEYLFNRLKQLEKQDGVVRTVTLDAQYRTHPLLGNFASDHFYKKYNEGYTSPPRSENDFKHSLERIENKAAIWINVPYNRGGEGKSGTSRQRKSEAQAIADYVKRWIDTEEASGLSFGIISFYKAQVDAVYEALEKYQIVERDDKDWQICSEYHFFKNDRERLRIGTVDAFQGMEFDIVFLSMVRSCNIKTLPEKKEKIFGHLMLENRLCVSMTRQKKALIVVGDADLIQTSIAQEAVPALQNFYKLCREHEQGVVLEWGGEE